MEQEGGARDMAAANTDVRFAPKNEIDHSAPHVRFVPLAARSLETK